MEALKLVCIGRLSPKSLAEPVISSHLLSLPESLSSGKTLLFNLLSFAGLVLFGRKQHSNGNEKAEHRDCRTTR